MVNETVLLTLLLPEPKHGYRLLEEADRAIGPDETFDTKRLYSTLRRLHQRGAVAAHAEPSPRLGAPPRKVYELTAVGRTLLTDLVGDPQNAADRRRFFLSLSLWDLIPTRTQYQLLEQRRAWLTAELAHFDTVAALPRSTYWSRAVLGFQRQQVLAELQWLDTIAHERGLAHAND